LQALAAFENHFIVLHLLLLPPRDGKGFNGFLPQLDEFYFTTGKKKISENADALFRIS
jgi:hypothetical protein